MSKKSSCHYYNVSIRLATAKVPYVFTRWRSVYARQAGEVHHWYVISIATVEPPSDLRTQAH